MLAVGPLLEDADDPRQLGDRRVAQAVRERLRPRRLDLFIAVQLLHVILAELQAAELALVEALELGGVARRPADEAVGVQAEHMFAVDEPEFAGDPRAPVAALGAVAAVPEAPHQLGPGPGDPPRAPADLVRRPRQRISGQ